MSSPAIQIRFDETRASVAVRVNTEDDLAGVPSALGLSRGRPVLVLVGGAGGLGDAQQRVQPFFDRVLVPLIGKTQGIVVDGGTDAGIMRLIGHASRRTDVPVDLVGVAAAGTILLPGEEDPGGDRAQLEPNHSRFLLVPGDDWGDESPWLARVAGVLAGSAPSVTVLVNGGAISRQDVVNSVQAGRPVITVRGSGREADRLADAVGGLDATPDDRAIIESGLLHTIDLDGDPASQTQAIRHLLS